MSSTETISADNRPRLEALPQPPQIETATDHVSSGNQNAAVDAASDDNAQPSLAAALFRLEGVIARQSFLGAAAGVNAVNGVNARPAPNPHPPNTREYWQAEALRSAGIDPANWDPSKGLEANIGNVRRVYEYYSRLYDANPNLQWAGMAKLAGGTVLAALEEIYALRVGADVAGHIPGALRPLAQFGEGELRFIETKLLDMQKKIFEDLAWQHEAYRRGGLANLEAVYNNGRNQMSLDNINAWRDIASGNAGRIERGNKTLLRREQFDILQPYYNEIRGRGRGVIGLAMAQAMSIMAHSPIPGGRRFTDVASDQWPVVGGNIPFTADITDFNDRWRWIENDMLPRWQALNRNNPRAARDLVRTDLQELANRNLLLQGRDVLNFVRRLLPPHFLIP